MIKNKPTPHGNNISKNGFTRSKYAQLRCGTLKRNEEIYILYMEVKNYTEIGRRYNLSTDRVRQIVFRETRDRERR